MSTIGKSGRNPQEKREIDVIEPVRASRKLRRHGAVGGRRSHVAARRVWATLGTVGRGRPVLAPGRSKGTTLFLFLELSERRDERLR